MKIRIIYSLIYILSVVAYLLLPKEGLIRFMNIFTSMIGVIIAFSIAGKFIWKKMKPGWIKPFRIILIVLNAMYSLIIPLAIWSENYANAFMTIIFIAPMTALLIETYIPRTTKEKLTEPAA